MTTLPGPRRWSTTDMPLGQRGSITLILPGNRDEELKWNVQSMVMGSSRIYAPKSRGLLCRPQTGSATYVVLPKDDIGLNVTPGCPRADCGIPHTHYALCQPGTSPKSTGLQLEGLTESYVIVHSGKAFKEDLIS